jgi:hypothetical protein
MLIVCTGKRPARGRWSLYQRGVTPQDDSVEQPGLLAALLALVAGRSRRLEWHGYGARGHEVRRVSRRRRTAGHLIPRAGREGTAREGRGSAGERSALTAGADFPRRRRHGDRQQVHGEQRRDAGAAGLRPVPGSEGAAATELAAVRRPGCGNRCRGADSCPPRSLRVSACTGAAGLRRPGTGDQLHRRARGDSPARQRPAAGRGRRARQLRGLVKTPPGAAAVHRGRCRQGGGPDQPG